MGLKYKHLEGKEWKINETDCFSLCIDFFKDNFGIEIPNFARPNDWDSDRLDLISLLYKKTGFEKLSPDFSELRPGDVLATSVVSQVPNHLVIYLGDNMVLHHLFGNRSKAEAMRSFYRMSTGYVLRHPDVPDLRPVYPDVTIEELLRARFRS